MRIYDVDMVSNLVEEFFDTKKAREIMHYVISYKLNDWEKWFQIEFAHFIHQKNEYIVEREVTAYLDPMLFPDSSHVKIDLVLREQDPLFSKKFIFIEVKCTKKASALIKGLKEDKDKIKAIRKCEYRKRSFVGIGFYLLCDPETSDRMDSYVSEKLKGTHDLFNICKCSQQSKCKCEFKQIGVVIY